MSEPKIDEASLQYAFEFVRSLDKSIPTPYIGIEPSGRAGIEWIDDANARRLAVSFYDGGGIIFAGVNQHGKIFSGKGRDGLAERMEYLKERK